VNGEWQEQTSYFNVTAWGQLGENAAQSLSKGARTIVAGRLEQREYETREGEKRSVVEVVADEIGPSLRWATAQVDRNDRREGGSGSGGGQGYSSGGASAGAPSSGGGGRQQYDDAGEEPF
jgi:single-strand DNA-binding protein